MRRSVLLGLCAAAVFASDARAQSYGYPRGYGRYGWGGWGSTVQGDIARGLGMFNMGAGTYNAQTAVANSINTNTVMRWNQATWASQQAMNRANYARRLRRKAQINLAQAQIHDRLRNHPEARDIVDGDALNVLLDILTNPAVGSSSVRLIREPLSRDVIRDIPFEFASEAMTICLDQITAKEAWPLALAGKAFEPERSKLETAVDKALKEDEEGDLSTDTIEDVSRAVKALDRTFQATVATTSPDYIPARDHIKTLYAIVRMLHSPKVDEILAELEKAPGGSLGDLIGFMQAFNLRFAPANSFRQRGIYLSLYPILAAQVNGPMAGAVAEAEKKVPSPPNPGESQVGAAAGGFFKQMEMEHVDGDAKKP
jgi:hypothetical protein